MNIFKTRAFHFVVGAGVLSSLGLMTPKAAHAIAPLLVQVENSATNPAITQGVEKQAAQLVHLRADASLGESFPFYVVGTDAQFDGYYTVPSNRTLVVTSIDITPDLYYCPGTTGLVSIAIRNQANVANFYKTLHALYGGTTVHFDYGTGFPVASGVVLIPDADPKDQCLATVDLQGYYTAN